MGKLAPIQIDIHLERGNLHGLPQIVGRSIRLHAAAAGGQTSDVNVYLLFVHFCSAVAHGMNNAPPVGIIPVPGTLYQGRLGYGFRRFFASSSVRPPVTCTVTNLVTRSPSCTMCLASSSITWAKACWNA